LLAKSLHHQRLAAKYLHSGSCLILDFTVTNLRRASPSEVIHFNMLKLDFAMP
jgi:hypothetical protein